MSVALARKYRPRNFATVAVQSHVANTLKGAIARGRVAHGYLLCGPRGTGKTTLARVLAMALNCERRGEAQLNGEPCGACESCQRIWSGSASLDVVEIDAASNRGVDDARELRERAMYAPSGDDRYKVYIVDEAHMLTREAWNALLKILEEPPPRVVFVFATTEPQKIAQAAAPVLSRLQRFDLKRIGPAEIRERLAAVLVEEGVPFEDDALGMIARAADGGLRDALSLADQVLSLGESAAVTAEHVRTALGLIPDEEYLSLLDMVAERRAADVFPAVQRLADAGIDFALLLSGLGDLLRGQLAVELGGMPPGLPARLQTALSERKGRLGSGDLMRMLHALLEIEPLYRRSGQQQLLLETLLVRFALLDRTVELEEVLKGFGGRTVEAPRRSVPQTATGKVADEAARAQEAARREGPRVGSHEKARPTAKSTGSLQDLAGQWKAVAQTLSSRGRGMVAQAIERLEPESLSPEGILTLGFDPLDDTFAQAVHRARTDVLESIASHVGGISGITLKPRSRQGADSQAASSGERITASDVRKQRMEQLASKSDLLGAAIKTLDLELMD